MRRHVWMGVALVLAAAGAVHAGRAMNHDVAWFMLAADRMLHGGGYLRDFFELNTPLAVASYIPAVVISKLPGSSPAAGSYVWTLVVVGQSAVVCGLVLERTTLVVRSQWARWMPAWIAFALCFAPRSLDFAQREQIVAALLLPFIVLMLDVERTKPIPAGLRIYIGALAGAATMIKPQFAILVPAVVSWRALRTRSLASLLAAEATSFAIVVAATLGSFLLVWRDWLRVVRWARDLYGAYDVPSFGWLWPTSARLLVALFALMTLVSVGRGFRSAAVRSTPLFLACAYSLLGYIQQRRGFTYQLVPFSVFVFVLVAILCVSALAETDRPARETAPGLWVLPLALSVAIGVQNLTTVESPSVASARRTDPLWSWLSARPAGESVAIFSTNVAGAFPAVTYARVKWASRYPCLWPLPGIVRARDGSRAAGYRQRFVRSVAEDLESRHAEWVLVDTYEPQQATPRGVRILEFLESDSEFRRVWARYEAAGSLGDSLLFARRDGTRPPQLHHPPSTAF